MRMSYYFTDGEINQLILEKKYYNGRINDFFDFKESDGHKKASVEILRSDGSMFIIKLRQNINAINDFSAIFAYHAKGSNKDFKLRRYNGKSHEHSNNLENKRFYNFHIHYATQRYQDAGCKEEKYAEETDRYSDCRGALKCLLKDCNIGIRTDGQTSLFDIN